MPRQLVPAFGTEPTTWYRIVQSSCFAWITSVYFCAVRLGPRVDAWSSGIQELAPLHRVLPATQRFEIVYQHCDAYASCVIPSMFVVALPGRQSRGCARNTPPGPLNELPLQIRCIYGCTFLFFRAQFILFGPDSGLAGGASMQLVASWLHESAVGLIHGWTPLGNWDLQRTNLL
jgi:hypothetical protein